jgi:hypothetical protein
MRRLVYGVGIYEKGKYVANKDGKPTKEYLLWQGMLRRCYSKKCQDRQPSYVGCSVDHRFLNFQYFMFWAEQQVGFGLHGYQLDKDFLLKGNKLYSPETCVFVPQEINLLIVKANSIRGEYPIGVTYDKQRGMFHTKLSIKGKTCNVGRFNTIEEAFYKYKDRKELYARDTAEEYKNDLDYRVYIKLMNYEVEITD